MVSYVAVICKLSNSFISVYTVPRLLNLVCVLWESLVFQLWDIRGGGAEWEGV